MILTAGLAVLEAPAGHAPAATSGASQRAAVCACSTLTGPCQFGAPVRLTNHAVTDFHPAFSPDGSRLL